MMKKLLKNLQRVKKNNVDKIWDQIIKNIEQILKILLLNITWLKL